MLFTRLIVENFGVYAGRHELDLKPAAADQPVVLIGGLNGAGKTTLLDAFRLVLYGKRAHLAERDQGSYHAYLRDAIHREADPFEGARIELEFDHQSLGRKEQVRVVRQWSAMGDKVYEQLEVFRDGEPDVGSADAWSSDFEQIMPLALSELFFFDGERVRRFTESAETRRVLTTAMTHLMGVGLVEQLCEDLKVLDRKTLQNLGGQHNDAKVGEVQKTLKSAREELVEVDTQLDRARQSVEQLREFFDKVDADFRRMGGSEYVERARTESQLREVREALQDNDADLRDAGKRLGPLGLVGELLEQTCVQAEAEVEHSHHTIVHDTLSRRDQLLVEHLDQYLDKHGLDQAHRQEVDRFLTQDRLARQQAHQAIDPFLDSSPEVAAELRQLADSALPESRRQIDELLAAHEELEVQVEELERRLGRVPDEDAIKELFEKRQRSRERLDQGLSRVRELERAREQLADTIERDEQRLDNLLRERVTSDFEAEDTARVLIFSKRVKAGLAQFRGAVLRRNLGKLERLVVNAFERLAHKHDLVADLHIDPESFELELIDRAGKRFSPEALSAGERQVLSVSMLWGLAMSSKRLLPTIIDTPLGRLDSEHRKRLVTEYIPNAGQQVIILSTDEEIVGEYLELLEPSISRCYYLDFDPQAQATSIEEGYFNP